MADQENGDGERPPKLLDQLRAALRSAPQEGVDAQPASEAVRVVAASVDASTRAVTFHVPRAEELPIAPVR